MNKVDIIARRDIDAYRISLSFTTSILDIKLDTGAKDTVISVGLIKGDLTEERLSNLKAFCEKKSKHKKQFISATGHTFSGYLASYHNVEMSGTLLRDFHFYLILENQRDIALLGMDFIGNCEGLIHAQSDIVITEFDEESYNSLSGAVEMDEIISFMDSVGR